MLVPDVALSEEEALVLQCLTERVSARRTLVAVAGAPGAGKTAFSERLVSALNLRKQGWAATVSVDAFQLDDVLLTSLGLQDQSGGPDAYDTGGLEQLLRRLRANAERAIALPFYDWNLGVSRGAARLMPQSTKIVIVDGCYLLSEDPSWSALRSLFDVAVFLAPDQAHVRSHLIKLWTEAGLSDDEASEKVERYDLPFGRFVRDTCGAADFTLLQPPKLN